MDEPASECATEHEHSESTYHKSGVSTSAEPLCLFSEFVLAQ